MPEHTLPLSLPRTLLIGASEHPWRYSFIAASRLIAGGADVVLIGKQAGKIMGKKILTGQPNLEGIDTVTLYLNAQNQAEYTDYLLKLKPRRVIFNPGAENPHLAALLHEAGVEVLPACTLVMLSAGMY